MEETDVPICGITMEPITDPEELHTSPGGSTYKLESILQWMDGQNRSTGLVYYPTREVINVADAISAGIMSEEEPENSDSGSDTESEYEPDNYLRTSLLSWLESLYKMAEDAENGEELSEDSYNVPFSYSERANLASLIAAADVSEEDMKNFHKVGRMLMKDDILHNIDCDDTAQATIDHINPLSETKLLIGREYIWSLELMIQNGFPIKIFDETKDGKIVSEIHYGGILDCDDASIKQSEMKTVTRLATVEIVDNFIELLGPGTVCPYLDTEAEELLSRETIDIISRHRRDARNRRRRFRRELVIRDI